MSDEGVLVSIDDGIARLGLNRPEKLNALDVGTLHRLGAQVKRLANLGEVQCMVLYGVGPSFCAGADLHAVHAAVKSDQALSDWHDLWHSVFSDIEAFPMPTIVAVQGVAIAGGFELAQLFDVVIIEESASFGDFHSSADLFPAGGGTQRLPRLIGQRRAMWFLLTGDNIPPNIALEMGLVSVVVDDGAAYDSAMTFARRLAGRDPRVMSLIKAAVREGVELPLREGIELERRLARDFMRSKDGMDRFARLALKMGGP